MNINIIDNENLTVYKADSPSLYVQKFPIHTIRPLSNGFDLERRGSTDSGVGLTDTQCIMGESQHPGAVAQSTTSRSLNSLKRIHSLVNHAAIAEDYSTQVNSDYYSPRQGNIACFFERKDSDCLSENGSVACSFEDVDLDYCLEDMQLEVYLEEKNSPKKNASVIATVKNMLSYVARMIVEPFKLPFYLYKVCILIVLSILNILKSALYVRPFAAYIALPSAA